MASSDIASGTVDFSKSVIYSDAVDVSKAIPYKNLKDRVVVITGGSSGFGAAISQELVKHGAIIIIGDISVKAGQEKIAALRHSSGSERHQFIRLDVTDWNSQAAFFKQAAAYSPHGGIDCVIANAGICDSVENAKYENPPDYQSMDNPPAPTMKTSDVNLTGVMYTTTLALSYLKRNPNSVATSLQPHPGPRDRHLILVSSVAGLAGSPSIPIYCASKHGVVGLFRALRITAPLTSGIRVNMINPYFVETAIMGPLGPLVLAGGGLAKIEDVADAAVRLVADKAIIGRGMVIGARGSREEASRAGLEMADGLDEQAVWDVYAHDFQQSDVFTRRMVGITNIVSAARGWAGVAADVGWKLSSPVRRLVGWT